MSEQAMASKSEILFKEAVKLRDSGKPEAAIDKLSEILNENRKSNAAVLGIMGNIYWNLKDFSNAFECYQKAVKLSPKSELASLGLFHTLWDMGRERDAFEEAKRFLSLRESEEYLKLIEEMRASFEASSDINKSNN
jgi:tetratricopeptide (TPR) repeat protein